MKILVDTHTLIWSKVESSKLSDTASQLLKSSSSADELLVSSFSIWEIALLLKKKRIILPTSLPQFLEMVRQHPKVRIVDVSPEIAMEACNLPGSIHGDPADQILVATARIENATILTRDRKILDYPHVKSLW